MHISKVLLNCLSIICAFSFSHSAYSVPVSSLIVTNWDVYPAGSDTIQLDFKYTFVNEILMGTYQGEPTFLTSGEVEFSTALFGGSLLCDFGGGCSSFGVFTSPYYGNVPTGSVFGNELSLDLSSWSIYGSNPSGTADMYTNYIAPAGSAPVNQWSTPVVTTYDPVTQYFTAYWEYKDTRSFTGDPTTVYEWQIEGYVHLVPAPAALWLFGSGLVGLIGVGRRKKAQLDKRKSNAALSGAVFCCTDSPQLKGGVH